MMVSIIPKGNAQEPYAKMFPLEGNVFTNIYIMVRGTESFGEGKIDYYAYVFWDDFYVGKYGQVWSTPPPLGFAVPLGIFDIFFNPPNKFPYSNQEVHNVTVEVWREAAFGYNFSLSFKIAPYIPCPEYLALNATYHDLLANYTNLSANYNSLLTNYTDLLADYNVKLANYSSLSKSYDSLSSSYDALETDYDSLKSNYDSLQSNNANLTTSYSALVGELAATRNLGYIFITTTMVLVATTIFFAARKPEAKTV